MIFSCYKCGKTSVSRRELKGDHTSRLICQRCSREHEQSLQAMLRNTNTKTQEDVDEEQRPPVIRDGKIEPR